MSNKILRSKIEIVFPFLMEIPDGFVQSLGQVLILGICGPYQREHPDRVMWPAEWGSKMTYLPLTKEEEKCRGVEFDDSIFSIRLCEKKKW